MNRDTQEKDRIFGLDFVRAMVVIFVIFHHLVPISNPGGWLLPLASFGSLGVELLFVLCGFLLGQSLLKLINQDRFSSRGDVLGVLTKRWLRIMPAYYFFFLLSAALFPPFLPQILSHLSYLFFLQDFAWNMPGFYFQTWTLAVLEFFYVLFSLAVFICWKLTHRKVLTFAVCMGVFLIVPFVLRTVFTPLLDTDGFEATIRRWVIYRLDSPVIGVFMALLYREFPQIWARLRRSSWIGLTLFGATVVYHLAGYPLLHTNHVFEIFFYPVVDAAFALTLPLLLTWKENRSPFGMAISYISQRSYSIYVSHVVAIVFILDFMVRVVHIDLANSFAVFPVCYGFILVVASLSLRFVEKPFVTPAPAILPHVWLSFPKTWLAQLRVLSRRTATQLASSLGLL